jgi:glutathione S-transferase
MCLLTVDNLVFRYYAVAAALMIVKMMSQGWITVFRMAKVNGGFRYPEDARRSLTNPRPRCRTADCVLPKHAVPL